MTRDDDEVPKHRAKKDTRRWCKGRKGMEHKPRWTRSQYQLLTYACETCGKHLGIWCGWWSRTRNWPEPKIGSTDPRGL